MIVQINHRRLLLLPILLSAISCSPVIPHLLLPDAATDRSFDFNLAAGEHVDSLPLRHATLVESLSTEAVMVEGGLLLLELEGRVEVALRLGQSIVSQPIRLQLQLLQRQSLLLLLPIIIRGVFSRIEILLGLVVLLVVVGVVALGLLLHIVQNNDSGATRRIQRLDYLQALRFIVVQKWLRSLAPQPVVVHSFTLVIVLEILIIYFTSLLL